MSDVDFLDIDALRPHFRHRYLTRVDVDKNVRRFYYIGWQETLFGKAVVRIYGRIDGHRRIMAPVQFDSLDDAWPLIRKTIRTRLRHGYQVIEEVAAEPVIRIRFEETSGPIVELEQLALID